MLTFPGICSNDLSADCALHRAVNTSTAAPVDTLQLEFVVDAAEPETHCLSLALNPMRWAFFEPPARDLTPVWPPMSGGLDLGCFMFPRVLFVQQGDAKLGEVLIYIIFATKAAGMCARARNTQVGWSGVKCLRWREGSFFHQHQKHWMDFLIVLNFLQFLHRGRFVAF